MRDYQSFEVRNVSVIGHSGAGKTSVLEAMLLGLPVVSTNVGGIRHLIENNIDGFLVPDNDAKKMAECIDILIHNPVLANLCVTNARNKIERLDWNVVKKSWNDLLF